MGEGEWLDTWLGELERAALVCGGCCPIMDVDRQADGSPFVDVCRENLDAGGGARLGKEDCGSCWG